MQSSRAQGGHQADATNVRGNGTFAGGIKQAFSFEFGFETQKLLKQSPLAREHHPLHHQLQLAAGLVHA